MDNSETYPPTTMPDVVRRPDILAEEALTAEQFAADFQRLRGRGHIERSTLMSARERIIAVVGQAGGVPVVAGEAAAIMHGTRWFDDDFTIELIRGQNCSGRRATGTVTRRLDLEPSEIVEIDRTLVTSPLRTAFDLGRQPSRRRALGRLDALAAATAVDLDELAAFARAQKHTRNVRQVRELIPHIDPKAESPGESWLRLFFFDAGMPKPESQVEVFDEYARLIARFDLAYPGPRVAIEYDGEEFHSSPEQKRHDEVRDAEVGVLGWVVVRVNKQRMTTAPYGVVAETRSLLRKRGAYFT
ncbi:hypothetical protein GYA93_09720 [Gordonia desulfuricans]|uniref:DUF559 domain-containing protein n=1 Tax=Gordonia desulfuricans TaxID=89051 RepID=A0A7K3LNQ8_9ACTN|nr:hypothetical protein [Gordonia desulfuricans]NDK89853.1 hypothetical protein [Gordonia desulfuricans]